MTLEKIADHSADRLIVFDQEKRFTAMGNRCRDGSRHLRSGTFRARQVNEKRGSDAGFALDVYMPSALLDHTVDDRKTQSGTFPRPLGGEKWLEDACPGRFVHAVSGVSNL